MNRRSFFKGVAGLAAVVMVPFAVKPKAVVQTLKLHFLVPNHCAQDFMWGMGMNGLGKVNAGRFYDAEPKTLVCSNIQYDVATVVGSWKCEMIFERLPDDTDVRFYEKSLFQPGKSFLYRVDRLYHADSGEDYWTCVEV